MSAARANAQLFRTAKKGVTAKQYDAQGNEVAFDVREDEEQDVKLQETVDLLLAAGYFRARIKGLSPFDKVVGGMTWCITASNVDVDVDLLFQENSTIGQKIALTEKIVAALPLMKCPHRLEPHQVQGLDFIHIYPVVQWLVKKALETREERQQEIRAQAVHEFGKRGATPVDKAFETMVPTATEATLGVREAYKPRRQFRAPATEGLDTETRVHTTLLEYGRRYGISRPVPSSGSKGDGKNANVARGLGAAASGGAGGEGGEEEDLVAAEEKRVAALMRNMSEAGEDGSVSQAALGSIVGMSQAAIAELAGQYSATAAAGGGGASAAESGLAAHKRALGTLQRQIDSGTMKREAAQETQAAAEAAHAEVASAHAKSAALAARLDEEMAKLDALEGDEANQVILKQLRALITLNESLKAQEVAFRAGCKAEADDYKSKIATLKGEGAEIIDEERAAAIAAQHDADVKKLHKIKVLAARRNREIAAIQRKIDEIPSRAELTQYQRRFVELYEQVAAKHRETKQYYTLYNTLDDTKLYMTKEVSLLNSIHDNFEAAMASKSKKEEFLKQFAAIVAGIKNNKDKVDERQSREKSSRDQLSDKYLELVDKDRQYYKTVRAYETECSKNEILLGKLKRRGVKA